MTKLQHCDQTETTRFVTFSTYRRVRALDDEAVRQIVVDELKSLRARYGIKIHGYVFMPDQVHLVLHLLSKKSTTVTIIRLNPGL